MTTIQAFTKASVAALCEQLTALVATQIGEAAGLNVRRAKTSYDTGTVMVTLELTVLRGPDGKGAAEKNFARASRLYGFEPSDYGRTFMHQGMRYTLTGFAPTRRKNPVMTKRDDGREYYWPEAIVANFLKKEVGGPR